MAAAVTAAATRWTYAVRDTIAYGLVQVGDGDDGVPLPMKPKVVVPDAGSEPL